jgi:alpha-L-rhamnosidase
MNSFNHYSYGSIVEWMFRNMAGINPVEDHPGFKHVRLAPLPNARLKWVRAHFDSPAGAYDSEWGLSPNNDLTYRCSIPFNASATLHLPNTRLETVVVNGVPLVQSGLSAHQEGANTVLELYAGAWELTCSPLCD